MGLASSARRWYVLVAAAGTAAALATITPSHADPATNAYELTELVVTSESAAPVRDPGRVTISGADLRRLRQPALADIAGSLGTLPGIVRESHFSGLLFVRGSQPYETLYVLNGVPLVNPYKWGGILLTFNPALVERAELYPGGFGPEYPETMAGVLEVDYVEGANDGLHGEATLGAETGATLQGPLWQGSTVGSYRRTFYDVFANGSGSGDAVRYPFFQDGYASLSQFLSPQDRLRIWCLNSDEGTTLDLGDVAEEDDEFKPGESIAYDARAFVLATDLEHAFTDRTLASLHYAFNRDTLDGFDLRTTLADLDWSTETDYMTVLAKARHDGDALGGELGGGIQQSDVRRYELHGILYEPNTDETAFVAKRLDLDMNDLAGDDARRSTVQYAYLKPRATVGPLTLTPGANVAHSDLMQHNRTVIDPRLLATYRLNADTSLRGAVGQYSRHALDYFQVKDSPDLKPERSTHYVAGVEHRLAQDWRLRTDLYYKDMRDLIVEDPDNLNRQNDGEALFVYDNRGSGYAEGVEIYLQKSKTANSRADGWISYACATTRRHERSLDKPDWYSPEYDQRHTLHLVADYYLSRTTASAWCLTSAVEYHTGRPYEDFNVVAIELDGETLYAADYSGSYNRLPDYFSLDLTLDYSRTFRHLVRHIFIEVANATNHRNVLAYYVPTYSNTKRAQTDVGLLPFAGIKVEF